MTQGLATVHCSMKSSRSIIDSCGIAAKSTVKRSVSLLLDYDVEIADLAIFVSQLLLDLMAYREQALRLILDLSSTVITLLVRCRVGFSSIFTNLLLGLA